MSVNALSIRVRGNLSMLILDFCALWENIGGRAALKTHALQTLRAGAGRPELAPWDNQRGAQPTLYAFYPTGRAAAFGVRASLAPLLGVRFMGDSTFFDRAFPP